MDPFAPDPRKPLRTHALEVAGSIDHLLHLLDQNEAKALEILETFARETPEAIAQLRTLISRQRWSAAAQTIHKIKTRFGYLGHDTFVSELTNWENHLQHALSIVPQRELEYADEFDKLVNAYIAQLQATPQFQQLQKAVGATPLGGRKILVAEDDEINALVLEMFVKELGGSVIKVTDGYKAVHVAAEQQPDMIFMDVHMPVFSGLDAIRAIRRQGHRGPIISLSASTRLAEREQSLEAGADDFLIKPTSREAIQRVLRTFFPAQPRPG